MGTPAGLGPLADYLMDPRYDFPRVAAPRMIYLIASEPRTASNLLCGLLVGTGIAGHPAEYFNQEATDEIVATCGFANFDAYMKDLMTRRTTPNGVFGVKAHYFQFAHFRSRAAAALPAKLRVIRLTRRDVVAQAVSAYIAQETGQWSSYDRKQRPDPAYDFAAIRHALHLIRSDRWAWATLFERHRLKPATLDYETFTADPQAALTQALDWLGIKDAPRQPAVPNLPRKLGTDRNLDWIARFRAEAAERGLALPTAER